MLPGTVFSRWSRSRIALALVFTTAICGGAYLARVQLTGLSAIHGHATGQVTAGENITVREPGYLDWTFAIGPESLAPASEAQPARAKYRLLLPSGAGASPSAPAAPVVLFVSAENEPAGTDAWKPLCDKYGLVFASPWDAGNDCPTPERVRIVLDVLSDLRRKFHVEPERTYIGGISGGARLASMIGFGLPEYFGGIIAVCAGGQPREEAWLRRRMVDLLSIALITGEHDFNRAEIERYRGPMFAEMGVRARIWTVAGMGHTLPSADVLDQAFNWLEAGYKNRRKAAARWPGIRVASQNALSRENWSQALLDEALLRLCSSVDRLSGLEQLEGIATRWPDVAAADQAKRLLDEYEKQEAHDFAADRLLNNRRFVMAEARALDAYASGSLPPVYLERHGGLLRQAIECWSNVLASTEAAPNPQIAEEATQRITALRAQLP